MRFYRSGDADAPVILLLPGTCCHWRDNFGAVIPMLERRHFQVICVSYDGFDETEDTVFPDMLTEAAEIEAYIQANFGGRICAAYGCSLGGSLVGLLVQRGNVHIDHAILGSSDLDQDDGLGARAKAWLVGKMLYGMLQKGRAPGFMERWLEKQSGQDRVYYEKMVEMFGIGSTRMAFVREESIRSQFYSDLATPLEEKIAVPGTRVHIFYAVKMGGRYEARYRAHFQDPDIRRHDMQHEELLVCHPERWVEEIERCCTER